MGHAVLLGDSIFDNATYIPDGPAVVAQLRGILPEDWTVEARQGLPDNWSQRTALRAVAEPQRWSLTQIGGRTTSPTWKRKSRSSKPATNQAHNQRLH